MMDLMDRSQTIKLHVQGKSSREIADIMEVSRNTANKCIRDYRKLHAQPVECDPEDKTRVRGLAEALAAGPKYDSSNRGSRKRDAGMGAPLDEVLAAEDEKRRLPGPDRQMLANKRIRELMVDARALPRAGRARGESRRFRRPQKCGASATAGRGPR